MRQLFVRSLGPLVLLGLALFTPASRVEFRPESMRIPGAYRALSFWGNSRAYPGNELPREGFTRGYERAKRNLARAPEEAFADRAATLRGGATAGWQAIGPTNGGGRTLTLAFDPVVSDRLYAGSASGGLWRSDTAGVGAAAWQRIDTGFPVLGVSTVAFEPGSSDVIYIGTGEVYNHQTAGNLAADRLTRGSYGIGVLKSTDGGATWYKSLDWSYEQQRGVWAVRVDPLDADIVWAATTEGVYKSEDAGQTWNQKLNVVMAMDLVLHPLNPQIALAGCGNLSSPGRGIYRTTDGGSSWTLLSGGGIPTDFGGKIQFGVTPAQTDLVFASIGNSFTTSGSLTWLVGSSDFGASWFLRNTTNYSIYQGWFAHDVAIHPLNTKQMIAVGIDIWRSTNSGVTLTKVSDWTGFFRGLLAPGAPEGDPDYSHADHHDVIYHPTDPSIIYFANDGGVFRSLDGGLTFEGVNGGYQSQQFYNGTFSSASDPDLFIGGLQDNSSAIYRGSGQWQRGVLGGDGGWAAIDSGDPDVVYATAQRLQVGKSIDGGDSFDLISPSNPGGPVVFIAPLVISPLDSQILYGATSYLFKTLDGGDQWLPGANAQPVDGNPILLIAVAPTNDDVVYLASIPSTGRGRVHVSTDGGATFSDITGTLPDRYPGDMIVDPSQEGTVYLTMSGFGSSHLFRSTDYGQTWVDLDQGQLADVPTTAVEVDPLFPDHLYVGNDIGVFFTADGGANWIQLSEGLPEATLVGDLSISTSNRVLRAGTHGLGVYERPLLGLDLGGAVPDGSGGVPLTVNRLLGGDVELSWAPSCSAGDDDYAVYEGSIGAFSSHVPSICSTGGATTVTISPTSGDRYFLVVPRSARLEGSYGVDGTGAQRPPGPSVCVPQLLGACALP